MLTLYYRPGNFSIAAHILLEESGQAYESCIVSLGEEAQAAYRKINSRGLVPAMLLDNGEILTENVAILPYLGKRFGFWPTDPVVEARALSLIGFFATTVATAAALAAHPERHTVDEAATPSVMVAGLRSFERHVREIDSMLVGRHWFFDEYLACDPYGFTLYAYGVSCDIPMHDLRHYTLFRDHMLQRGAVQRVVESEGTKL